MGTQSYCRTVLDTLIKIIAMKDLYTAGHQYRVADLSYHMAEILDLPAHEREGVRWAALVHDLGKIFIPTEILCKPSRLTSVEMQLVQLHVEKGYEILKEIPLPWPLAQTVLEHHERMDGNGYPAGLKGFQICLAAKILAVADTVEAMASHRPYRAALGIEKAMAEIDGNRGNRYDPAVVDACLGLFQKQRYRFPEDGWDSLAAGLHSSFEKNQGIKTSKGAL